MFEQVQFGNFGPVCQLRSSFPTSGNCAKSSQVGQFGRPTSRPAGSSGPTLRSSQPGRARSLGQSLRPVPSAKFGPVGQVRSRRSSSDTLARPIRSRSGWADRATGAPRAAQSRQSGRQSQQIGPARSSQPGRARAIGAAKSSQQGRARVLGAARSSPVQPDRASQSCKAAPADRPGRAHLPEC